MLAQQVGHSISIENDRFEAIANKNIAEVDSARRYTIEHGRTNPKLIEALAVEYLPKIRESSAPGATAGDAGAGAGDGAAAGADCRARRNLRLYLDHRRCARPLADRLDGDRNRRHRGRPADALSRVAADGGSLAEGQPYGAADRRRWRRSVDPQRSIAALRRRSASALSHAPGQRQRWPASGVNARLPRHQPGLDAEASAGGRGAVRRSGGDPGASQSRH